METSDTDTTEQGAEASTEFSPNLIEERMKSDVEPLHAQITTLTQMMSKLIQDNWARVNPLAGSRDHRFKSAYPLTDGPGTSRTLPLASLVTVGYSPDNLCVLAPTENFVNSSILFFN